MQKTTATHGRSTGRTAARRLRTANHASPQAAVLELQRMAGNRATRSLMRAPVTTEPAPAAPTIGTVSGRGDVVTVDMSDGTRYEVTRKHSTKPIVKKKGQFGFDVGSDKSRVWLAASWCRGTRGEIKIGGNPQGAAKDVLENIAKGVVAGKDAEGVKDIIKAAEIQPFVEWDIQRPGDWRITGDIKLTVDKSGVTKVEGKLEGQKGPFSGGIGASGGKDGWDITIHGEYKFGSKPKTDPDCPRDEIVFPYEYSCELLRDIKPTVKQVPRTVEDRFPEHRYVYFKYASDEINPKLTTKDELKQIEDLMAAGYKVTNIQAFTSPEGLRDPSKSWKEGNKALAKRRGEAALNVAAERCLDGGCITGNVTDPKDVELLPLDFENLDGTTSEGTGRALEDEVIRLWETDPDVAEQRTPAANQRVAAAASRHAKAEIIYGYLRRARIDLEKVTPREVIDDVPVPGRTDRTPGCRDDVMEQALSHWRRELMILQ
jgi:hypothetical protein